MKKLLPALIIILVTLCAWQQETIYLATTSKPVGEVVLYRDGKYHCIVNASQLPEDAQIKSVLPTHQSIGLYHDYEKMSKELRELETLYPDKCSVYDIGDSIEGRDILALRFQPQKPAPGILFVGEHHAREWMSVEIPMALANLFAKNPKNETRIEKWLSQYDIWIVPMLNPDGHQFSIVKDRLWRKNRRPFVSTYGVDLNRNYSYKWSNMGASGNSESDTYRGEDEFSEPETQAIRNLAQNIPFIGAITYHTYGNMILHSWGYGYEKAPYYEKLDRIGNAMAKLSGVNDDPKEKDSPYLYKVMEASKLYAASGDMCDYFYSVFGTPSFTYEMTNSTGGFVNDEKEIQPTVDLVVPMSLEFLDALPKEFCMVYGKVSDEVGNPVAVDILYKNIEFPMKSNPLNGRFYHVLPKGPGYLRYKFNGKETTVKVDFKDTVNVLNLKVGQLSMFDLSVEVLDKTGNQSNAILSLLDSKGNEVALTKMTKSFVFKNLPKDEYLLKAIGIDNTSQMRINLNRNLSVAITID